MQTDRLVRAGPLVTAPLGSKRAGFSIAAHVLGHSRLLCDARVLEILAWHGRPRTAAEVATHFDESERGVAFVRGHLVQAQLLVPEGFEGAARIRDAFASKRAPLPSVAPSMPLARAGTERWGAAGAAEALEASALALSPRSQLVLSPHVASLAVAPGETIALHPAGERVHLRDRLWRLARAFRSPASIAAVAKRLGLANVEEAVAACQFLVLRRLLWASRAAETRALDQLAKALDVRPDGPSVRQWSEAQHQWTDVATPYDWDDVRRMRAFGRLAVVGQCQINFAGAALQRLAQHHHVHLRVSGGATPWAGLARTAWAAVVLSLSDHAAELHDAAARGDWNGAERQIPRLIAAMDELVGALRQSTTAPIAVVSVAPPALSSVPESATSRHLRARLYADLNHRLACALAGRDVFLLDESGAIAAGGDRIVLDDEYTGAAHHCAYNPRFWIPLTQWGDSGDAAATAAQTFPAGDPQAGASGPLAARLFDFLRRVHESAPVRAVVFDPDTLLWPGRIGEKLAAHESLQRSLGRPDYQLYCGINEALLVLRARGVKLVCMSRVPAAALREKWNVPPSGTSFVSAAHLDGVARTSAELAAVLGELGLRADECLCVGLGKARTLAGARVLAGDPWSFKRYFLTAPELTRAGDHAPCATPASASSEPLPRGSRDANDLEAIVNAAIARRLGSRDSSGGRPDDLRALGLDSFGALDLAHEIEASAGVTFADRDLTVATIYRRSGLIAAAKRAHAAASAPGRERAQATEPEQTALDVLGSSESIVDVLLRHAEAARHPWQLKMVRSTRPNDYEYAGWGTLLERAHGYAELFSSLGGKPGDVVTLMLPQGIALVAAFLAAILHDFVPSIVAAPSEKLSEAAFAGWFAEVAARSETRLIVCAPLHEDLVRRCLARSRASGIPVSSLVPAGVTRSAPLAPRTPNRPLLLQHSSGTTGLKKGVLLGERATLAHVRALARALRCDGRDVVVSWAPLYHDMGLIACLLLPLLAGIPIVMMSPFDWLRSPALLLREITRERGTLSWMPNFAFLYTAARVDEGSLEGLDLSSWRALVNCSEPVTERAAAAFHQRFAGAGFRPSALSASYAMAETTFAVSQVPPGRGLRSTAIDAELWRRDAIARPLREDEVNAPRAVLTGSGEILPETSVEIVDASGRRAPEGHAGEIRVRCDSLMEGYFGDPDATAKALRDGWYSTGDTGVILGRELYVTGRTKDLVIVGGHNVYPHDVEESVGEIPGIRPGRVVALGVADEALDTEALVILAETRDALDAPESAALVERIRAHVSSVFGVVARDVRLLGERTLLKSTSGKLSRARNRALYLDQTGPSASVRTTLER